MTLIVSAQFKITLAIPTGSDRRDLPIKNQLGVENPFIQAFNIFF